MQTFTVLVLVCILATASSQRPGQGPAFPPGRPGQGPAGPPAREPAGEQPAGAPVQGPAAEPAQGRPGRMARVGLVDKSSAEFRRAENQYIVVLEDEVDLDGTKSELRGLNRFVADKNIVLNKDGESVFKGFVAKNMNRRRAEIVAANPKVKAVIQDIELKQSANPWNIDRIDERYNPLDGLYVPEGFGNDAHIYVFDTGCRVTHSDFGGRAKNFYAPDGINTDNNGHGTSVASIAGGRRYGVAKGATIHSVKVTYGSSSGHLSQLIAGMFGAAVSVAANGYKAVFSVSFFTAYDSTLNFYINYITDAFDIPIIVTVGFPVSGYNPCFDLSPSSASKAYVVSGSTQSDQRFPYAADATCVDIFAPAANIQSAYYANNGGSIDRSGHSFAVPHVAGVAAIIRDRNPSLTALQVKTRLSSIATHNTIGNTVAPGRRLLYTSPHA